MKRYFVKSLGYNMICFVDNNNMCYAFTEHCFDVPLTVDTAKTLDYSVVDGCDTAYDISIAVSCNEGIFNFDEILNDKTNVVIEF